jgi:hypothetical protein
MSDTALSLRVIGLARAAIGVFQGLALYLIYLAYDTRAWPATDGLVFAPLLLFALFIPLLVSQGIGTLRPRTLAIWAAAATVIVVAVGAYDIWHAWPVDWTFGEGPVSRPHILPSPELFVALVAGLFIAQSLVTGGDIDRKLIADYTTHFDVAWKIAVQAALAVAFTGAFWGLLVLGAGLFRLINIEFFFDLLQERWFAIPATTLAVSAAIHVTDVRAGIVRGIRTLGLSLLSWLLPLMTLIAAGFLGTLVFTGVQPLWDTQFATALLLIAFGALVVLLNAAYHDGHDERAAPRVLRYPGSVAALALIPLAALAGYALFLRIEQYGWTAARIYASACALVAVFYAVGYALAAIRSEPWLKRIEQWNFYGAILVLAVLFALFTPIADPYRISVASQVARLESGAVTPEQFDFANLRWEGGRFGQAALERLKVTMAEPRADYVRDAAARALVATNRSARPADPEIVRANVTAHPAGTTLPPSFLAQDWGASIVAFRYVPAPGCLRAQRTALCDAWMMDLDGDGADEIVVLEFNVIHAYRLGEQATWVRIGTWNLPQNCERLTSDMVAGRFATAPPEPRKWPDLEISGLRIPLAENPAVPACPN